MKNTNNNRVNLNYKLNGFNLSKENTQTPKFVENILNNSSFEKALYYLNKSENEFKLNSQSLNNISKELSNFQIKISKQFEELTSKKFKLDQVRSKAIESLAISSGERLNLIVGGCLK